MVYATLFLRLILFCDKRCFCKHKCKVRKLSSILLVCKISRNQWHFLGLRLQPSSYDIFRSGINKWRDSRTPKQILEKYCETNNYMKPRFIGNNKVIFNGDQYLLDDFGKRTP